MPHFPIVDSHVHLFDIDHLRYDWLSAAPQINRTHGLKEYNEACGQVVVDKIVFAEVDVAAGQHLDEARWVQSLAESDGRICGSVAHAPLTKGAAVEVDLEKLKEYPTVKGIRHLMQTQMDQGYCLEPGFLTALNLLPKYDFSFDLCVKHWGLTFAIELARRCPDVRFVLDHIGKPGIKHGLFEPWRQQLRELAKFPNVTCKVSGVITEADHRSWSAEQIKPYVDHTFACFGFKRAMYGSDWPVSVLTHDYPQWVQLLDEVLAGCSDEEQQDFYRNTAIEAYKLA
ncbi:MAG: amidohydrolase family protein [Rhodospirillales bacterium]|nr:amidohydrolase family protein [Rhodospirillales bacterium]